jgi:hypothetical protein
MAEQKPNPKSNSWRGVFVAIAFVAGGFGLWQFWPVQEVQPKLVQKQEVSKTFYRLKASYTYTGKNGAEPLEFDVVAGCALQLTQYITGDVSGMSSRVPTMVAYEMSDGGAIGIAIPKACRGSTSSNGEVPADFLPATIQYEDAKDLSLGKLYASEDAYESPLAKLKFHGASIERATEQDFRAFIDSERFTSNLILIESSKDLGASNIPITDEMRENPKLLWKQVMPRNCFGMARVKMPKNVREYLKQFWKPGGARYWMVSLEHSRQMKDWLRGAGNQGPSPIQPHEVKVDGSRFEKYDIDIERTGGGIVTRGGGGSMAARNPRSGYVYYLPPDYFPYKMISAAPWLEATSGMADANKITVLAADDMKGFMYCYNYSAGAAKKKYPNAKLGFISPVQRMELMVGDKLIQNLSGEAMRFNWLDYVFFFDSLEFIYWKKRLQL